MPSQPNVIQFNRRSRSDARRPTVLRARSVDLMMSATVFININTRL
jgi:hypothetical protein